MPFAPHEIENKRFVVALRGYQTHEVDAFLRAVAADYTALVDKAEVKSTDRWMADIERIMSSTRDEAERDASDIRTAAVTEAAAIRGTAARDAAELSEATRCEAEACFAEITRQAEELNRLQTALWTRMHALEHTVAETRQTLAHAADIYPLGTLGSSGPAYRKAPSVAAATNGEVAIAAR